MKFYISRDADNYIRFFVGEKPQKASRCWISWTGGCVPLDKALFQEVKWSYEEPTNVKLEIVK